MVTFTLKDGINRLVTEVEGVMESVVLEAGKKYSTEIEAVIRALDAIESVIRVESASKPGKSDSDAAVVTAKAVPSASDEKA